MTAGLGSPLVWIDRGGWGEGDGDTDRWSLAICWPESGWELAKVPPGMVELPAAIMATEKVGAALNWSALVMGVNFSGPLRQRCLVPINAPKGNHDTRVHLSKWHYWRQSQQRWCCSWAWVDSWAWGEHECDGLVVRGWLESHRWQPKVAVVVVGKITPKCWRKSPKRIWGQC